VPVPKVSAAESREREKLGVWGWSTLGGAGAVAVAALAVTLRSDAEFEDLRRRCRDQRCFPDEVDTTKVERLDHTATALWITSAGVATTAAALLTTAWLRARRHDREKVELRISGRGLRLDVRF
jgi:hypothetical protein